MKKITFLVSPMHSSTMDKTFEHIEDKLIKNESSRVFPYSMPYGRMSIIP